MSENNEHVHYIPIDADDEDPTGRLTGPPIKNDPESPWHYHEVTDPWAGPDGEKLKTTLASDRDTGHLHRVPLGTGVPMKRDSYVHLAEQDPLYPEGPVPYCRGEGEPFAKQLTEHLHHVTCPVCLRWVREGRPDA